jgi:hypothetical protein
LIYVTPNCGAALGVSRTTVIRWLEESNVHMDNAYPDNRVKVSKDWQAIILAYLR